MALAPALLCWVSLFLPHSSDSPPAVPPFSPPPDEPFACERSVRLEDEPVPSHSLLWRLLEIQQEGNKKQINLWTRVATVIDGLDCKLTQLPRINRDEAKTDLFGWAKHCVWRSRGSGSIMLSACLGASSLSEIMISDYFQTLQL